MTNHLYPLHHLRRLSKQFNFLNEKFLVSENNLSIIIDLRCGIGILSSTGHKQFTGSCTAVYQVVIFIITSH